MNDLPSPDGELETTHQHLLFVLGNEHFAVPINRVREITDFTEVTPVPMTPPHLRGVINLRGKVLPVVDLNARFGRPPTQTGRRTSIIVIELGDAADTPLVGVLVNAVTEVTELPPQNIAPPPSFGASIRDSFISGLARHQDTFVVVLELSRVLSLEELSAFSTAGAH